MCCWSLHVCCGRTCSRLHWDGEAVFTSPIWCFRTIVHCSYCSCERHSSKMGHVYLSSTPLPPSPFPPYSPPSLLSLLPMLSALLSHPTPPSPPLTPVGSHEDPLAEMHLLPEPLFTLPSDNIGMVSVVGTPAGRIFLAGQDGCLHEVVYQADDGWFHRKCRRVNHSTSVLSYFVPSFLSFSEQGEWGRACGGTCTPFVHWAQWGDCVCVCVCVCARVCVCVRACVCACLCACV